MDNKITRERVSRHFEYDWLKYVAILVASVFLWVVVFMQINVNRSYEQLSVFVGCYHCDDSSIGDDFLGVKQSEDGNTLREVTINLYYPTDSETYNNALISYYMTCDVMIVGTADISGSVYNFIELTDDLIEMCVPESLRDSIEYYTVDDEGSYNDEGSHKMLIRVDNLLKIKADNPHFNFSYGSVFPDDFAEMTEEQQNYYSNEKWYIGVNVNSDNAGKQGKNYVEGRVESYEFVRYFLTEYGL